MLSANLSITPIELGFIMCLMVAPYSKEIAILCMYY